MRTASVLLLLTLGAPAAEIRHFRYERPIQASGSTSQMCVAIDSGVFAHAAPQLNDLRLYNGTTETPYVLRVATGPTPVQQEIIPLNLGRSGNATTFDAAMPAGNYADVLLAINAHDFIASVTVSGSQQRGAAGQTRLGVYTIFDLSRQKLGRSTVLHLPLSDFRFLHFRIEGPVTPENVTGISAGGARPSDPKFQTVAESSQTTEKGRASVVEFDVPAHTPVDRVLFTPGEQPANFSRDVTVSVRSTAPPDSEVASRTYAAGSIGNLLRVHRVEDGHRIDEERLSVDAPAFSFDETSHWTIKVENGDDPPLKLNAVRLEMIERSLCFDAAAGAGYTLYYGDAAIAAPQYDYERLFVPQRGAQTVRLGPERANPEYQARPDERPFTERHPALLWIALGAVVLVLGVVALRSAKMTTPSA